MACSRIQNTPIEQTTKTRHNQKSAPTEAFRKCAFRKLLKAYIREGYLVETWRKDIRQYWIAVVLKIEGCWVRLRWFGSGLPETTFRRNAISQECPDGTDLGIHPVGYCTSHRKALCPPSLEALEELRQLSSTGKSYTLNPNYDYNVRFFLNDYESDKPLTPGMLVETSNFDNKGAVTPARVESVKAGFIKVSFLVDPDRMFTAHQASNRFHAVGWGIYHNALMHATGEYIEKAIECGPLIYSKIPPDFASQRHFPLIDCPRSAYPDLYRDDDNESSGLSTVERNMTLEVVDITGRLRIGYIVDILPNYYFLLNLYKDNGEFDSITYHVTSPYLLRRGFAEYNSIDIHEVKTDARPVPAALLNKTWRYRSGAAISFEVGHEVEVFDGLGTEIVRTGHIKRIVEHLLLIGFRGSPNTEDIWIDFMDPHLLPSGFSSAVGFSLQS